MADAAFADACVWFELLPKYLLSDMDIDLFSVDDLYGFVEAWSAFDVLDEHFFGFAYL